MFIFSGSKHVNFAAVLKEVEKERRYLLRKRKRKQSIYGLWHIFRIAIIIFFILCSAAFISDFSGMKTMPADVIVGKDRVSGSKNIDIDYLMIVDDSRGKSTSDPYISRSIDYHMAEGVNGLFADLYIHYANNGKTSYEGFTEVHVPTSSLLIACGMSGREVAADENGYAKINRHPGQSVFEERITIGPGDIGILHFYYKLPDEIHTAVRDGRYSLYVQKQPGINVVPLNVDFQFLNGVKSYYPTGFYVNRKNEGSVGWKSDLGADRIFKVNFVI